MKRYFSFVVMLFLALSTFAQGRLSIKVDRGPLPGVITGGIKVDMNLSHFWGGKLPHGMRNGGQVGLWAEFRPASPRLNKWSISPEIVFSSQGGKFTVNQALAALVTAKIQLKGLLEAVNQDIIVTENYLNIPVMVKYRLSPYFSIEAGPYVGFNVYSKARIDGINAIVEIDRRTHVVDFGIGAGGTYYLTDYIMFHARYHAGLTHTFKDIDDKNGNIQMGVAYRF